MDENRLKKKVKSDLGFGWIIVVILVVAQICFDIYAIITVANAENSKTEHYIFSILGVFLTLAGIIKVIIGDIIPCLKDVKFYGNNEVERMRAVIVKITSAPYYSYKMTVKNLETGAEAVFEISSKKVEINKIYDFIYLKHSKIYEFTPVSFEQLTEDNREKASKIDFNQKD